MSCTCVDSAKFGPRNTCPYPPNRTCATLQLYCAHQSPMDQNSNSEQNNTVREAIEVVDEPRELPVTSQSAESCRTGLSLGIGTLETRTVTSAIARELLQRAEDNPGNADFLALGLGDDKLAVQIRALASGNAQEDSLVLSSDHMHPFNEVGTMGVNGPSVAETSSPVTTVLQSSHPRLTLRSLEPLEYGSSLGMHDQDTPSHQEQRLQLTAGGQPPRKRHCPTASESEASTPEQEFGPNLQSQLLAESMLQGDNFTTRLASSGPIGMAAAAAITSGQKKKKPYTFESNPALRKRHKSKLLKRLRSTMDEFTTRVGVQACLIVYQPGKAGPDFNVYGADPLSMVVDKHKEEIVKEVDGALTQAVSEPKTTPEQQGNLFELPPLVFEGIPTPVSSMTQCQLRTFIPLMLKYSQNRGKPGWGKGNHKPIWWPESIPWSNVRSDPRHPGDRNTPWTDAMRQIVLSCYMYHGRLDLLPESIPEQNSVEEAGNSDLTQQLQQRINQVEIQQEGTGQITAQLPLTEESQVFIETGEGDDDEHSELATLSDGTLTETAARLQQQADETGQVQYATQTVTVCEKDSQALGQPAGTTTTVLLTAYPGGQRIMDESSVEDYRLQEETGQGEQTEGHESLQAVDQYLNTTDPRDVSLAQALTPADLALVSQFMTATKSSHIDN